jgi:hypothetical protein
MRCVRLSAVAFFAVLNGMSLMPRYGGGGASISGNLKNEPLYSAAAALGRDIPASLLARADKVIE